MLATIEAGYNHFVRLGKRPRIAVAGINPHCGENGLFGTEDAEFLAPAVELAQVAPITAPSIW